MIQKNLSGKIHTGPIKNKNTLVALMVNNMKIAVIGGGYSAEREVSLRSAKNVYEGLLSAGFDASFIDLSGEPDINFAESLKK